MKFKAATLSAVLFFFASDAHAALEVQGSQTFATMIAGAILVGVLTAFVLYKAAHAQKKIDINVLDVKKIEVDTSSVHNDIRDRVRKLATKSEDPERAVREISKIVEEETHKLLQEIKQEYSVKYQVVSQERQREVEVARNEYRDVKEKFDDVKKAYKQQETEKKTTEAVVRGIAEGIVVVNNKGEVLLMNPSAERLLGVKKEKKIGRSITEDVRDEMLVSFSRDVGEGKDKVIEFKSKDENTKKILRSSSAVIQNENGQTIGMVNILTDVTKQKELDEMKSQFVSNVTHELRTPIVAMQKAIAILQTPAAGQMNDQQQNFVGIVSRNLGHLSRLVEDLLDIAKIESGKMRFKSVPTRLDRVIMDACETLDTWAKSKDLKLVRDVEKGLPDLPMDPDKITQVLNNLIGNAIKFTPNGGQVTVKAVWNNEAKSAAASVTDTGVGIAQENLKKLFGRFEQFGDQTGINGTGLGLSITKEIVERHGGQITVESKEGKGSTFTFTLPLKQPRNLGGA